MDSKRTVRSVPEPRYVYKAHVNRRGNDMADLIDGKIPASELPSLANDVIEGYYHDGKFYEDSAHTKEITGETGKIYVDLLTNKSYRWNGSSDYVLLAGPDILPDSTGHLGEFLKVISTGPMWVDLPYKLWNGSKSAYEALEEKSINTLYIITDETKEIYLGSIKIV